MEKPDDHFKQTGLAIVFFDRLNNPIWSLKMNSPDEIFAPNHFIGVGEEITINDDKRYTVRSVELKKLIGGWQVGIKVD